MLVHTMKKFIEKFCANDTDTMLYWSSIVVVLFTALVYGIHVWFVNYTGMYELLECKLKAYVGIDCPGCGGTRALKYLFRGDVLTAIYYNAFAVYGAITYIAFFITQTLQRITKGKIAGIKFKMAYLWIAIFILIVQYIFKLTIPGYTI